MIFNLKRPGFGAGSFTFDGTEQPAWASEGAAWMMAVPVSGTLTLAVGIPHADLCLVAAGKPGKDGSLGQEGGAGGELVSIADVALPAGAFTVTVGESGQDTTLLAPDGRSWTARSGYGSAAGRPGADGVLAWDDADTLLNAGWLYGAGGGYGSVTDYQYQDTAASPGGSVGEASSDTTNGHGGPPAHPVGYPGLKNTGQGGGGGRRGWTGSGYSDAAGGAGGSGILLIRSHKEVTA